MPTVLERVAGHCGELVLRLADDGHHEVIANGVFLMDTRNGESERLLVTAAADRMPAAGQVLVGGLGVGFSLCAAVAHPRVRRVTVVEREPAVIRWAGELARRNREALDDPRVEIVEADLVEYLGADGPGFDAVCLDIDNGPHWTVTDGNRRLYEGRGLDDVRRRLTAGGVLAVWSAAAVPEFEAVLRTRFDEVQVMAVAVMRGEPDTVLVAH